MTLGAHKRNEHVISGTRISGLMRTDHHQLIHRDVTIRIDDRSASKKNGVRAGLADQMTRNDGKSWAPLRWKYEWIWIGWQNQMPYHAFPIGIGPCQLHVVNTSSFTAEP